MKYQFGPFLVDDQARLVWRLREEKEEIPLTGKPLAVLLCLLQHPGQIVRHKTLALTVWNSDKPPLEAMRNAIYRIRQELGDDPESARYVETVEGGYRFIGTLANTIFYNFTMQPPIQVVWSRGNVRSVIRDEYFETARAVDMLGVSLAHQWFGRGPFRAVLRPRLLQGNIAVRVLMPHNDSPFLQQFADEWTYGKGEGEELQRERQQFFLDRQTSIDFMRRHAPSSLRLLKRETVCSGIVRVDNLMVIGVQRFPHPGGQHAHLLLCRMDPIETEEQQQAAQLFDAYKESFDLSWKRYGEPVDADDAP